MVNLLAVQDNGEWQLLTASAERNVVVYDCCPEPYIDITATIFLRSTSPSSEYSLYCDQEEIKVTVETLSIPSRVLQSVKVCTSV
jgi:hypothetical protein